MLKFASGELVESTELARLRRVPGKQTTRLTHYGRKTGKPHEVTIWFVLDGDRLYIGTANVNRQWVRNVQKTPKIKLAMGGETFEGNARFLTDQPSTNALWLRFDGSTGYFDLSLNLDAP
jgi:deazaflavin-dependent oxidoreductase (nitroreductase family)